METNLCSFLYYSVPFVLTRGYVDTAYFDVSKTFDKLNPKPLLHELFLYDVFLVLIRWFQSDLTNHRSSLLILNSFSDHLFSSSGVPQGSTLGPLSFITFITAIEICKKQL